MAMGDHARMAQRTARLGPWQPGSIEERIDRLESLAAIQQLAQRYGVAVDSRDIDMLVELFVPDVRVGRDESGREALHRWYTRVLRQHGPSCHLVANHVVDFDDADHAHGIVYCHDELSHPEDQEWAQGMLQYWDTYARVDGEWFFHRRRFHRLYIVDWLTRPSHHGVSNRSETTLTSHWLPDAFPSWQEFWDRVAREDAGA